MTQNLLWAVFKNGLNAVTSALVDTTTNILLVSRGGASSKLNATAAVVLKATPGRVGKVIVVAPGSTSGAFTLNDCATTGAATTANTVWTLAYNGTANVAGAMFELDFPVTVGLVLSAVPGGGSPQLSISFT